MSVAIKRKYALFLAADADDNRSNQELVAALAATAVALLSKPKIPRTEHLFRRRWDEAYLRNLAAKEGSFVSEYRMAASNAVPLLAGGLRL